MKAFKTGFSRPGRGGGQSLDCLSLIMLSTPRTRGLRQPVGPPARPVRVSAEYLLDLLYLEWRTRDRQLCDNDHRFIAIASCVTTAVVSSLESRVSSLESRVVSLES